MNLCLSSSLELGRWNEKKTSIKVRRSGLDENENEKAINSHVLWIFVQTKGNKFFEALGVATH